MALGPVRWDVKRGGKGGEGAGLGILRAKEGVWGWRVVGLIVL